MKPSKIILGSSLLGAIIGAFCVPTWSAGVESAEVLAGLVRMPFDNPTYLYHTGVYSFWCIQLSAILLKMGLSAKTISILSSGLECATAFAAISACSLIFFRSVLTAILCPLLFTLMLHPTEHGYAIMYLPSIHVFGQMGMYSALLCLSLLSLGYRRLGLFLLGMLPSIHASIALMAWTAALVGFFPERKKLWAERKKVLPPFFLGVVFTAVTLAIQKIIFSQPPIPFDHSAIDDLMRAFTLYWDPHRHPMLWRNFRVDLCIFAYAIYRLNYRKNEISEGEKFFLTGITGMTVVAAGYCAIYNLFPQIFMGTLINTLLLKRWLNLNTLLMPLLAVTLLAKLSLEKRSIIATGALVIVILLIIFGPPTTLNTVDRKVLLEHWQGGHLSSIFIDAFYYKRLYYELGLLIAVALPLMKRLNKTYSSSFVRPVVGIFLAFTLGIAGWYLAKFKLSDHSNFVLTPASSLALEYSKQRSVKDGILIPGPGSEQFIQLFSHQGVLLDLKGLTQATYKPSSIVKMEEILNTIYGTSFRNADDRPRMEDGTDTDGIRDLWEHRSVEEWKKIRQKYNTTVILADSHWKLQLPLFSSKDEFAIYEIP
jgi:hypothetical protein